MNCFNTAVFVCFSDLSRDCGVKKEGDTVERWTRGHRGEMKSESTQEAILSPEGESQVGHVMISETISYGIFTY